MPVVLRTPVPIVSAYCVFADSDGGVTVRVLDVASNEVPEIEPPVIEIFAPNVVESIANWLNLINIFAMLVGIFAAPLNGVTPTTAGGVVFVMVCEALPVVNVIWYG